MSERISEADARELLRVMHEDQGLRHPGFSREFAFRVIQGINCWLEPDSYYPTIWLERWEGTRPVEAPPETPPEPLDDQVPF